MQKTSMKQALVICAALCVLAVSAGLGSGLRKDSGIRCVKQPGKGAVEYEYRLDRNIRSFLVYKEYYDEGELHGYEVVRAGDVADTGMGKSGRLIVDTERHLSDGGLSFLHRFEGEESFVRDYTVDFLPYGYQGMYQGMMEDYFLSQDVRWKTIHAGQDLALAAWHLMGEGQDAAIRPVPCQEFMNPGTKRQAVRQNEGEILYYLVFSDKDVRELEEEYAVSSYARTLYEARCPYIGDAPAVGKLIENLDSFSGMGRTMELETREEPYVLKIHYEDRPQDEVSFYTQMKKNAVILLCLIGNAGGVEWTYPAEAGSGQAEHRFYCGREQAASLLPGEDPGSYAKSEEAVQELLVEHIPDIEEDYPVFIGLGVETGENYPKFTHIVGRLPGEEYDDLYWVVTNEAQITMEDVAKALANKGVSEKLTVFPDGMTLESRTIHP